MDISLTYTLQALGLFSRESQYYLAESKMKEVTIWNIAGIDYCQRRFNDKTPPVEFADLKTVKLI